MSPLHPEDLRKRTFRFTCDVYEYCQGLERLPGLPRRIAFQLFDAAASVGANLEEAKAAYSRREFSAKNAISLKECREAKYRLRVAEAKSLGNKQECARILGEADELIAILTTTVRRLQIDPGKRALKSQVSSLKSQVSRP
jgi:four helix bundle protein